MMAIGPALLVLMLTGASAEAAQTEATPAEAAAAEAAPARRTLELAPEVQEVLEGLSERRAEAARARLEALRSEPRPEGAMEAEEGYLELEWSDLGLWVAYRPGAEVLVVSELGTLGGLLAESVGTIGDEEPVGEVVAPVAATASPDLSARYGWRAPVPEGEASERGRRWVNQDLRLESPGLRYWRTTLLVDLLALPTGLVLFAAPVVHWLRFHRPGAALGSFALRVLCSVAGGAVGSPLGLGGALVGIGVGLLVAMVLDYVFLSREPSTRYVSVNRGAAPGRHLPRATALPASVFR